MTEKAPQTLLDFSDKTVLVTGSSSGIGVGIATRFAQAGADVIIHYNRRAEEAHSVARLVETVGGQALTVQADVANQSEVQKLFDMALAHFGRIDVLINNAGIYPRRRCWR